MINITSINLVKFAQKVYELSSPQGLGFLQFTPEPLSEEQTNEIVNARKEDNRIALNIDYVDGRACKMIVFKKDNDGNEGLFIQDSWYDHTDEQLKNLLSEFNIKLETIREHGCACNCIDCRSKQLFKN